MIFEGTAHQKPGETGRLETLKGEAQQRSGRDEVSAASHSRNSSGQMSLLERAFSRNNVLVAWKRVKSNKGSPGIDGMSVEQAAVEFRQHWPAIRKRLLNGTYWPSPVRRVIIPKPAGGERMLGIPTVLDRLIQQSLLQILQPMIDPTFSDHSHGFRPGRRAHDAVLCAQHHVEQGFQVVVDIDLEKFFDRVNHDILMDRLARHIDDKGVLCLIRRYLQSGVLIDGVAIMGSVGTPQGGPLSPFLANVLLDEVDKELEKRGHRFVRYADDCNVYVRSQRAGERVLRSMRRLYAKLRLSLNEAKTFVGSAFGRKFLGYCLRPWSGKTVKISIAPEAIAKLKLRIKAVTGRANGNSMVQVAAMLRIFIPGWKAYFHLAKTPRIYGKLDSWLRHRLRAVQLKHWGKSSAIYRGLRRLGASQDLAKQVVCGTGRWWRNSGSCLNKVLTVQHFDRLGFPKFL
jgi:RNA-directed DNA polymerase